MGEMDGGAGEIEVAVAPAAPRFRVPPRRLVLGLSALGLVAAVGAVVLGLDEPASKVVVRSGGSEPESSISVGFTSTLPETTEGTTIDSSTAPDDSTPTSGNVDPGAGGPDSTTPGGPEPTSPPPTAQPPGPTSTVIPTLPPVTVNPTTTTWAPPDTGFPTTTVTTVLP